MLGRSSVKLLTLLHYAADRGHMRIRAVAMISKSMILSAICVSILSVILFAGLWPFTSHPRNQVSWLVGSGGLEFGDYGNIRSSSTFSALNSQYEGPSSLEIWLQPRLTYASTALLSFYTARNTSFTIRQQVDDAAFVRGPRQLGRHVEMNSIDVAHVFRQGKKVLIAITTNAKIATVYLDGETATVSSSFGLSSKDFAGELIIGHAPDENDNWSGQLLGLSVYNYELSAAKVKQHYDLWARGDHPQISETQPPVALYLFNEKADRSVRNQVGSGPDLYIPQYYEVADHPFLETPWKEFYPGWGYYENLGLNIVAFIPLGFFLRAYFEVGKFIRRAALASVIGGLLVSLTIEILQAYIPVRNSGMTDLITNTLGTGIGASLYGLSRMQNLLATSLAWIENLGMWKRV